MDPLWKLHKNFGSHVWTINSARFLPWGFTFQKCGGTVQNPIIFRYLFIIRLVHSSLFPSHQWKWGPLLYLTFFSICLFLHPVLIARSHITAAFLGRSISPCTISHLPTSFLCYSHKHFKMRVSKSITNVDYNFKFV